MNMKKVVAQIEKRQNLEENLRTYGVWLMGATHRYHAIRLALNYYTYFEVMADKRRDGGELSALSEGLHRQIASYLGGDTDTAALNALRRQVISSVEKLTAYTDCFQIYEYVLNRMERRYEEKEELPYSEELFAREVMQFILGTGDKVVMNSRIQDVVGQLPVRMTKAKFFHLLRDALSIYKGSEVESVESLLYMIRTSAMIKLPDQLEKGFEEMYEILTQFRQADYKTMEAESYREYTRMLTYVTDYLNAASGDYMLLQDIINDLYVLKLSAPYAMVEVKEKDIWQGILKILNQCFLNGGDPSLEELEDKLVALEGRQENIYEKYLAGEFLVEEIRTGLQAELDRCQVRDLYERLFLIEKLTSTSPFMELEEKPAGGQTADDDYLRRTAEELEGQFMELFASQLRPVSRAVMAKTLSMLPVFFNSVDEISQYIKNSLEACQDAAEKQTCMELLKGIMNSGNEMV